MSKLFHEVFEAVIQLKIEAMKFYIEASRKTVNPLGKQMFITLAQDKKNNTRDFEVFFNQLKNGEKSSDDCEDCRKCLLKLPDLKQLIFILNNEMDVDDISALKKALNIEHTALEFFTHNLENCSCKTIREFYIKLIDDEKKQIKTITETLEQTR